jgi:hypothetical protein
MPVNIKIFYKLITLISYMQFLCTVKTNIVIMP